MGVQATFEHLIVRLSPAFGQVKRSKALGDDDSDSFSCRGSGERKCSGTSSIRTHANGRAAVMLNRSTPMFHNLSPPLPTTATSLLDISMEAFGSQYDINYIYHYLASVESDLLQQAQSVTDQCVRRWLRHAEHYLAELIRLEGRGDFVSDVCYGCGNQLNDGHGLRCDDCHDQALYCLACSVTIHERLPLHRIQRWTGKRFEDVEFSQLNFRIYLGHAFGEKCPTPDPKFSGSFVVLDLSGFHQVVVQFCGCKDAVPPYVQLLRQRWFPAVCGGVKTAATFRLLEHFHLLSSQSNISALGYYRSLLRMTNNTGVDPPMNQLPAFLVMIREWQVLKALKRAGSSNYPNGIRAPSVDCAVDCPACSIPKVDLSGGYALGSRKKSWLYRLSFIARHSKSGNPASRSNWKNDASKISQCPHGVIRPNLRSEVLLGTNTFAESPFASSIVLPGETPPLPPVLSDDIRRHQSQSSRIRDFLRQTDMDAIARGAPSAWANADLYGDLLDCAVGTRNWDKVTTLPMALLLDAEHAVSQRRVYDDVYNALTNLVPHVYVEMWLRTVLDWEMEGEESPNPFEAKYSHLTQKAVRADLYREDLVAIHSGQAQFVGDNEGTPSTIIAMGLDLEEEQRRLHVAVAAILSQSSGLHEARLVEEQGRLRRRIEIWHGTMQLHLPLVGSLRTQPGDIADSLSSQDLPLFLPSALCSNPGLPDVQLLEHEWRLREAQAYDALAELRGHLQVIEYVRVFALQHPDAEEKARQAGLVVDVVRAKICMDVCCYRAAHAALKALAPALNKTVEDGFLYALQDGDVQYISTELGPDGPCVSWIWRFGQTAFLDPAGLLDLDVNHDLKVALHVEWCEARAHTRTSSQLCKSLKDEMHCAIAYHQQRAHWWQSQVGRSFADRPDYLEGANSYALRQASIRHSMKEHYNGLWSSITDCMSRGLHDLDELPGKPTRHGKQDSQRSGKTGGEEWR